MPTALFRADASPAIGGGHVMRCLSLARFLKGLGWECTFAAREETNEIVPLLAQYIDDVRVIDGPLEDEPTSLNPPGTPYDLFVVDHYRWDASHESRCRNWARRIMVIDDLADRGHDCDILLDQTYGRDASDYAPLIPENAYILTGAGNALLRPEFGRSRAEALDRRKEADAVHRILISLGAGDPEGRTAMALAAIGETGLDHVAIDVLTGATGNANRELHSVASRIPQQVVFHGFDADMAHLMTEADLAIGAAGATSWERCCLGLPTLMVVTADNQRLLARELVRAGAAVCTASNVLASGNFAEQLVKIARDRDLLTTLSENAAAICDGLGCGRVAGVVIDLRAHDEGKVRLRPACVDDAALMYDWQRDPQTRRFAREPSVPSWDEHLGWLESKLDNPNDVLCIIMHENNPSGVLRIDRLDDRIYEISIYVCPTRYRLGLGRCALDIARTMMPHVDLIAEILPNNTASQKLFLSAGYTKQSRGLYVNSWRARDSSANLHSA